MRFTVIDDGRASEVEVNLEGGRVRLPAAALERALGFELREEGLCRGALCIPLLGRAGLLSAAGVDLERLAGLLERPLALDLEARAASLGESAAALCARQETLEAPDFELPDLEGRRHRLSDLRGRKVALHAFASW
jgi:hypothetical protein